MIVEIAGIDGSGKTTLIHHLRRKFNENTDCWAYERSFKSYNTRLLEQIALNEGKSRADDCFNPAFVEFARALEMVRVSAEELYPARFGNKQLYFVDNYITEWLARAVYKKLGLLTEIRKILNCAPKPDFSFYLSIQPALALERLSARDKGDSILSSTNPLETLSRWTQSFGTAREMLPYAQRVLDASSPVNILVDEVYSCLEAQY